MRECFDRLVVAIKSYDDVIKKSAEHRDQSKARTIDMFQELSSVLAERKKVMIKQIEK